uniref:ABC transporter ATP-binding protein n=1 Tax=Orrella sp. TaxID=1921583 RepID=UPI0040489E56
MSEQQQPLLEVKHLQTGYGASQALFDVSLIVPAGQCVSLQGRNGMGKSTTVSAIMGLLPCWQGDIQWQGQSVVGLEPFEMARLGIGLVPEGRQVFPNLTVWENLVATAAKPTKKNTHTNLKKTESTTARATSSWDLDRVFALFPKLADRRKHFGNQLSGGEQQMLAIARALMTHPTLLILDEATEGLSPLLRQEIWQALATLRHEGLSILITDKNIKQLLTLCDHHVIVQKGRTVWSGDSAQFRADADLRRLYLAA